jgi:hypothetical protein
LTCASSTVDLIELDPPVTLTVNFLSTARLGPPACRDDIEVGADRLAD